MDIKFKAKDGTIVNINDKDFKFKSKDNNLTKIPLSEISNARIDVATLRVYTTEKKEYYFILNKGDIKKLNPFVSKYSESNNIAKQITSYSNVEKSSNSKNNDTTQTNQPSKLSLMISGAIVVFAILFVVKLLFGGGNSTYADLPTQERLEKMFNGNGLELGVIELEQGEISLTATFEVFSNGVDEGNRKVVRLIEQLKKMDDLDYNVIKISMYGKYTNEFGEPIDIKLFEAHFNKDTVDRINIDKFISTNLPDVADLYAIYNNPEG